MESKTRNTRIVTYLLETEETLPVVVICPGGGYRWRSPREGEPIARAFNQEGFHAVVVEYNLEAEEVGDGPLLDLSWAVAELRSHAQELKIIPDKITVCGFSAGGHLAASLGVFWNDETRFPDETVRQAHKPNAMILNYPVITSGEYAHKGSFERLCRDGNEQYKYSLENYVTSDTPPCFIWHTVTDPAVPVQNTLLFVEQLIANQIPVEVMLFPEGGHGLSLATPEVSDIEGGRYPDPHVARWFGQCADWLKQVYR